MLRVKWKECKVSYETSCKDCGKLAKKRKLKKKRKEVWKGSSLNDYGDFTSQNDRKSWTHESWKEINLKDVIKSGIKKEQIN